MDSVKFEECFYQIIGKNWTTLIDDIKPNIKNHTYDEYYRAVKDKQIYPHFKNIFHFTQYCNYEEINVVIIGQDPYHSTFIHEEIEYPQAMGLCFSVDERCKKLPPSLLNIYKNMIKYNHIDTMPKHGNLERWANQNVLMLNASLTVEAGKPNSHSKVWNYFTEELITELSKRKDNIIFVLWGNNALDIKKYIRGNQRFIISSHPSPLACSKKLKEYDSFENTDHFGLINQYLIEDGKQPIQWKNK